MLKSLDILIGFSVIMLAVSMSVTLIVQWALNLFGMRGKKLLQGVIVLLRHIDPDLLTEERATELATRILSHPMLATDKGKMAEVVQREDLIKTILSVAAAAAKAKTAAAAASSSGTTIPQAAAAAPANAEEALVAALAKAGIPDPGATLDAIRMASMKMEAARPGMATHVREAVAVIQNAESQFVARLNGAFDQTMERVSHNFTAHSRLWAIGISLVLALILQLDSFRLVNRLAMDDALRNTLVQQAQGTASGSTSKSPGDAGASPQQQAASGNAQPPAPGPTPGSDTQQALSAATQQNLEQLREMATDSLITWPSSFAAWKRQMFEQSSIFGLLLTAALLSLGAPFWFNVLGDLLKLRPMLATKEDAQRQERETAQPESAG